MAFYQRIRDLREDNDLTQQQAANIFYMQLTQYGRYERGERELPFEVAAAIAEYYNVSLDYLAGRTNTKDNGLTSTENELIKRFRTLESFEKGQVFERISALSEKHNK